MKLVAIEGTQLNIIKAIHDKPRVNILLNSEKLKAFHLNSGSKKDIHSHHFYSNSIGSPHSNHTRRNKILRNKAHWGGESRIAEKNKTVIKETDDNPKKWKEIYRLNAIPIKLPMTFFYITRTDYPKIYMEP